MKLLPYLVLFLLFPGFSGNAQQSPSQITIIFTANLNAALDDCGCSDSTVGGLNRVKTVIDSLRHQFPHAVLVDGGDFLSSYPDSNLNHTVVNIISRFDYDVMALGDQELVEGISFFKKNIVPLPVFAHNFQKPLMPPLKKMRNPVLVRDLNIITLIDPQTFDFISPQELRFTPVESSLPHKKNQISVLILHGTIEKAVQIAHQFPEIPLILVGHDQRKKKTVVGKTTIISVGSEGEFVAVIQLKKEPPILITADFLPVTKEINPDPQINLLIQRFYDALK